MDKRRSKQCASSQTLEALKLSLDASVVLAAAGSEQGASRWIVERGSKDLGWQLWLSEWAEAEVQKNLNKLKDPEAAHLWFQAKQKLFLKSQGALNIPIALAGEVPIKDRPILLGALYQDADILLTWDREHFGPFLDQEIKALGKLRVMTPGSFLKSMRALGKL